jgi:hypothetical protein
VPLAAIDRQQKRRKTVMRFVTAMAQRVARR